MRFSRKRQSILVGLAKVGATLAPNMQFYFYRIDMRVMGAKWSRALALLLRKEERGSSKAWSWKSSKNGSGTMLPTVE
jgi:hypothetical protein